MTARTDLPTNLPAGATSRRRRWVVVAVAAVAVLAVGAVVALVGPWGRADAPTADRAGGSAPEVRLEGPPDATPPDLDTAALTAGVEQASVAKIDPVRLADGVVPPTNRWYSGLVFGEESQPVFAQPVSFALTGSGFTLGVPDPVASDKAVVGPHVPAVTVDAGAASAQVSAADPVSVTIDLLDAAGAVLGHVVLAEGSPFVSLTAERELTVASSAQAGSFEASGDGPATVTVAGTEWALVGADPDGTLAAGSTATWYPVPQDADADAAATLAEAAADPVTGVDVTYGVDDDVARTTLTYRTAGGAPTAYVLAPHHRTGTQPERDGCDLGTYPSVYGSLELCAGSHLTAFAPTVRPTGSLDLDGVPDDERTAVVDALTADVAATEPFPSDTYFGGKALFRAASLVTLGEQLGADDVVADLRTRTTEALREWAQPDGCAQRDARCFVYDADARSAIGLTPSFGSDELNDHHFHYGYLLAAAGLLAADDASLADDVAPVMDLLAADVASPTPTDALPQLRSYDPWFGHSWASGTSPFADGNNQESSSEAVNAWNGLGLWAQSSGQDDLATQAAWLTSTEAASARAYWTAPDLDDPALDGFGHEVFSISWGAKRDYATWFSPEPSAILGIQLIPMGPVQTSLATDVDPERIRAAVEESGLTGPLADYVVTYSALAGPDEAKAAWETAVDLPEEAIDDGSSRASMLAFIASVRANPPAS
ncbi:glycosyl hydrolase [Cellulomonas fimi]|uniref:glucan endo-1,3-beta-D-glucosidase n=1 Tax=Cellulomonas fimi (strain ATCC 484 / DSM 20113 / JCM 1341 / CCUG 24087 / LMG 16345 / NBRC 15513 / NCIMB 8980 / NCTC 7547 / NRS-133) TaxID=590998 RepID=F4H2E6_CELFA|nr:glycosyl hydrolase [Cellulomonas fimi]AEE47566.1 glycoside hydrolase family 81 [Cellulomonas fimi ATCC 484]NNH07925.1 1,3-beta-glucanase [Cellulomonas fimi]VEH36548.1 Glycosyl hydrolase family 81 [Cellulomonas fimi]